MKPHKWAKEIKAWADGAIIQWHKIMSDEWIDIDNNEDMPMWSKTIEYRIKPQPKEPQYLYLYQGKTTQYIALSDIKHDDKNYDLIGRVKIESEWEE